MCFHIVLPVTLFLCSVSVFFGRQSGLNIILSEKFKRIYAGLLIGLISWILNPVSYFFATVFLYSTGESTLPGVYEVPFRTVNTLLLLLQILATIETLGGLVDIKNLSTAFKRAIVWALVLILTHSAFALFDTFVAVVSKNAFEADEAFSRVHLLARLETPMNLMLTFLISFCVNAYILHGYSEVLYTYGGGAGEIKRTFTLKRWLLVTSFIYLGSFTAFLLMALPYDFYGFYDGFIALRYSGTKDLNFALSMVFLAVSIGALFFRVVIQFLIVRKSRLVWKTVESVYK